VKWLLVAGVVLFLVYRFPTQVEYVGLAGLVLFLAYCARSSSTTLPAGGGAGYRRGPCGFCGQYSRNLAGHEGGHLAAAEALGYQVTGAVVRRNGTGFTAIPGWTNNPWHTMVIAAAGTSGENRERWTDAGLNGSRHDEGTDAWWVHTLAPRIAKQRGVMTDVVIADARSTADRLVASNARAWRDARDELARYGQIGDVT
jgi:hypothetical protein